MKTENKKGSYRRVVTAEVQGKKTGRASCLKCWKPSSMSGRASA